jgi:hypothetical protein
MRLTAFRASLAQESPPPDLTQALRALWLDARGDWDGAHDAAQADEGGAGDWVHAYLHRKEGDAGNAPIGTAIRRECWAQQESKRWMGHWVGHRDFAQATNRGPANRSWARAIEVDFSY